MGVWISEIMMVRVVEEDLAREIKKEVDESLGEKTVFVVGHMYTRPLTCLYCS